MNIQDIRERRILKITKGHTREYCQNIKIDAYIIHLVKFFYLLIWMSGLAYMYFD